MPGLRFLCGIVYSQVNNCSVASCIPTYIPGMYRQQLCYIGIFTFSQGIKSRCPNRSNYLSTESVGHFILLINYFSATFFETAGIFQIIQRLGNPLSSLGCIQRISFSDHKLRRWIHRNRHFIITRQWISSVLPALYRIFCIGQMIFLQNISFGFLRCTDGISISSTCICCVRLYRCRRDLRNRETCKQNYCKYLFTYFFYFLHIFPPFVHSRIIISVIFSHRNVQFGKKIIQFFL